MFAGREGAIDLQSRITEGPIWRHLLSFFFPILLGTFFQQLYNTVDAIIVGNFVGTEALAAVGGPAAVLINFLVNLFVGLSSGATVIVAQYYGARQIQELRRTVHTAIALAIAAGLGVMVLGIALSYPVMVLMGTPAEVMDYSLIYLRIYFVGSIASFLYNVGSSVLRAIGDTKRPLYFLIAACLTNIVLDLIFVVGFGLEVLGVALATVLSQIVSAVLVMLVLCRPDSIFCIARKEIRFHPDILKSILRIGLPTGLQSDMYTISNMLIQSCINSFGTSTMAAWTAFCKLDAFYWMISGAFGISITTFVGQNFGAQRYDRVRKSVRVCLLLSLVTALLVSGLYALGAQPLLRMFSTDTQVIEIGTFILWRMSPFYFTFICVEVMAGAIRGTGDSLKPMLLTCGGVCVLRVVWIFTVLPLDRTLGTLLLSYPMTWSITSLLFIIYYVRGNWMPRQIQKYGFSEEQP
ncbi:MATE family efflux transporter [Pseudoflavonifractor sp. DSM 107456]|uniref:MATE family efflux transporter n=1 Tax=Pseudoflavonifractor gallinarum TaxID=2779352 RepID=A0ABR9RF96_9FIRM|nr:MATE family efflux transporter [Pseudoflavonifractor gallinarum]